MLSAVGGIPQRWGRTYCPRILSVRGVFRNTKFRYYCSRPFRSPCTPLNRNGMTDKLMVQERKILRLLLQTIKSGVLHLY